MKLTLIQSDIVWADPVANRKAAEEMMLKADKSDVYILPEMFSTGFATQPEGIAEPADNDTLRWMKQMADNLDAAVCGSVAVCETVEDSNNRLIGQSENNGKSVNCKSVNSKYYNRFYFVKPGGEVAVYNKKHLFTYGGEHLRFTAGEERCQVEWRGVKFNICICYDLRFPIWSRNSSENPYDVQIYVASWPESRRSAWDALLLARAIENQCFVAAVNRVGDDPSCHYNGGTCLIDAYGKTVVAAEDGKVQTVTAELDMEKLNASREKFPVLKDGEN